MVDYQRDFVGNLASSGGVFLKVKPGAERERERWLLQLKDVRPSPHFVNTGNFNTGSLVYKLGGYFGETLLANGLEQGDVLLGPSHKGSALVVATAMYLALKHKMDVPIVYDRKEEGTFIGLECNTGQGLVTLGRMLIDSAEDSLGEAGIVVAPSYESNILSVATAIMTVWDKGKDLGFAYDRVRAKGHGEGSGAGVKWVGKTPGKDDKVLMVYNSCLTSPERSVSFADSIRDAGAEVINEVYLGYDEQADFLDGSRVHLLDDVGTSMATKLEMIDLLERKKAEEGTDATLSSVVIGVDREQVGPVYADASDKSTVILGARGEDAIGKFTADTGVPVISVLGARQMIQILYDEQIPVEINGEMKPLDDAVKAEFDEYMRVYGAMRGN